MTQPFAVPGAPDHELSRSPASAAVGRLAAASGLGMFHFEHRVRLPLPEEWLPADRPDLAGAETWRAGVLPEAKYQSFRHDLLLGSFHPGHRAKWTGHELCHGLVGFAWRPDASRLFHALAARLAEVLPVALWYFLDEAGLRRCPEHTGGGPLFGTFCPACEEAAARGPVEGDPEAERWLREGRAFVDRELAAVQRSVRLGRPVSHRLATLDLASDGLAYAAAHGDRLDSPAFRRFVETFFTPGQGLHDSLDALEARVLEVCDALCGVGEAAQLAGGRWRWITQDVGWRLLQVHAETEGEAAAELERMVDRLAHEPSEATVGEVVAGYAALFDEWVLPDPEDVFAVGYDLPGGVGRSVRQVAEGIPTACPRTWEALGSDVLDVAADFVRVEEPARRPLGRRFAAYLEATRPGPEADLARYEAAVAHAAPADATASTLGASEARDDLRRLADGVELLTVGHDVGVERPAPLDKPLELALARGVDGDVRVAEVSPEAAAALRRLRAGPVDRGALGVGSDEVAALEGLGFVVPVAWGLGGGA
ncbi:MAG: hypothetical protein ACQEXJ_08020 [Myxococcota bacterium]